MAIEATRFKDDEHRTVYAAQIWEIRKAQIRKYGLWDPDLYAKQISQAIRRFGTSSPTTTTDRGKDPKNVPASIERDAKNAKKSGGAAPSYPKAIAVGESLGRGAPWEYGAVHPKGYRELHPHGMPETGLVVYGEGADYPNAVYWTPNEYTAPANQTKFLGKSISSFGNTLGGRETGKLAIDKNALATMYGTENYVKRWREEQLEARAILAQRILHTIGSAVLAAFPATTAFAPAAYAAGNAAIDIQEQLLSDDPQWADIMDSINVAVAAHLDLNVGETPEGTEVKATNEGQVLGWEGMEWSEALDLGYDSTLAIVDAVNAVYDSGDPTLAIAVLDDFGIVLPEGAAEDLVEDIAVMTGVTSPQFSRSSIPTYTGTSTRGTGSAPSIRRMGAGAPISVETMNETVDVEPTMGGALAVIALGLLAFFF